MLTYTKVKNMYLNMGYRFHEDTMALNLGAIRSTTSQSNKFDDTGFMAWVDEHGGHNLLVFAITTDPGKYYLQNPMNKKGCIIMVPGQYLEVYGRGLHNGKYECFKQRKEMCYVRDYNKDITLDFSLYRNPEKRKIYTFWGINGTNLHRASEWKIVQVVEKYSAGCQVVQDPNKFRELIALRDKSVKFGFSFWDYTLFEDGYNVNYSKLAA